MPSELAFLALTLGKDLAIDIGTSVLINAGTGAVVGSVVPGAGNAAGAGVGAARGLVIGVIKVSRSKKYVKTVNGIRKIVLDKKKAQSLLKKKKSSPQKSRRENNHNDVGGEEVDVQNKLESQDVVLGKKLDIKEGGLETNQGGGNLLDAIQKNMKAEKEALKAKEAVEKSINVQRTNYQGLNNYNQYKLNGNPKNNPFGI